MVRVDGWGFLLFINEDWARKKERGHDGRVVVSAILRSRYGGIELSLRLVVWVAVLMHLGAPWLASEGLDMKPIRIEGIALDEADSRGLEYDIKATK